MIEKFSDEELKQILSELGIKARGTKPNDIVCKYRKELAEIYKGMPLLYKNKVAVDIVDTYIRAIIALTFKKLSKNKSNNWITSTSVGVNDVGEYEEMYQEILEIIKKHNREWKTDA